jgi:glycine oxidase
VHGWDTIVVGGGIIGAAVAWELGEAGQRVLVLDRQQPGLEASWAAAGMLAPGAETPDSVAVAPLGRASLDLYPDFIQRIEHASGLTAEFEAKPGLQIFFEGAAEAERREFVRLQRGLDLPAEEISLPEARAMEPALSTEARAVARMENEGRVDSRRLLTAVLAAAAARGADVRGSEGVQGLKVAGGRCTGVQTASGIVRAAAVVVAAGSFSSQIAEVRRYAPTRPVRGQMVALRTSAVRVEHVIRSQRGYIVPRRDGRLICGSTAEDAGYEKRTTPEGIAKILAAVTELAPVLAGADVVETWSGLRPDTPDHLPVLGPTDVAGLFIATGHYRNGILLTPLTARMMRDFVLEGKTGVADAARYSPLRFGGATARAE